MKEQSKLTAEQQKRYERQLILPELGIEGQKQLATKCVVVVGAGGLGSPIIYYLAAAGVGEIRIVDDDTITLSNLQRQILYTEADLGKRKALQAVEKVQALNSDCTLVPYPKRFTDENARSIAKNCHLIIDACDNLATRYVLDRVSEELSIPYLYGAVEGFTGQIALFRCDGAAGYADLFPSYDKERDKEPVPILGAVAGVVGGMIAVEALKVLLGFGHRLAGKLLQFDALTCTTSLLIFPSS